MQSEWRATPRSGMHGFNLRRGYPPISLKLTIGQLTACGLWPAGGRLRPDLFGFMRPGATFTDADSFQWHGHRSALAVQAGRRARRSSRLRLLRVAVEGHCEAGSQRRLDPRDLQVCEARLHSPSAPAEMSPGVEHRHGAKQPQPRVMSMACGQRFDLRPHFRVRPWQLTVGCGPHPFHALMTQFAPIATVPQGHAWPPRCWPPADAVAAGAPYRIRPLAKQGQARPRHSERPTPRKRGVARATAEKCGGDQIWTFRQPLPIPRNYASRVLVVG
jgi:hypothetical protein